MSQPKALPVFEVVPEADFFAVHRNGRYLMSPAGQAYIVPAKGLAEAVVAEWSAQGEKVDPATLPISQMVATTLDVVRKDRTKTLEGLLAYASSELLCQRAETPASLAAKQEAQWQPLLDWCRDRFGAAFFVGHGVMPARQSAGLVEALAGAIGKLDDYRLTGLSCSTESAGSLVLGLALAEGIRTAEEVFNASELDVLHQAIVWGDDPVTQARQAALRRELEVCVRWFELVGGG